jgi:tryptophan-rich sensory protein
MRKFNWKPYAFWILLTEAAGALSGLLAREGIRAYTETAVKPPLTPPAWVFPLAWVLLYALMGAAAARVWLLPRGGERLRSLALYLLQLGVNFFWSIIFFSWRLYGGALLWLAGLWALVLWLLLRLRRQDPPAAKLLIPCQLWLTFALYLNLGVFLLNG